MIRTKIICSLLALLCAAAIFSGCGAEEQSKDAPAAEQSPEPVLSRLPDSKSGEQRKEEQTEAMKDFLIAHQAEMEEIVAVMMEYSNSSNYYEYDVRRKILSLCDRNSFRLKEKYTDHTIIDKASILDENLFYYVFVQYENPIVDIDACCFTVFICDENGIGYCRIWLFYCEGEPIEKEFYPIFPVIPHWYLFVEYLE